MIVPVFTGDNVYVWVTCVSAAYNIFSWYFCFSVVVCFIDAVVVVAQAFEQQHVLRMLFLE